MTTTDTQQVEAIDKINKIRRRALIDGYRSLTLKDGTASLALVQARADVLEILDLFDARAAVGGPRGDARELGADTNFPLSETLRLLVQWAQHLHVSHECDCDGWEQRSFLIEAAQRYRHQITQAAAPADNDAEGR